MADGLLRVADAFVRVAEVSTSAADASIRPAAASGTWSGAVMTHAGRLFSAARKGSLPKRAGSLRLTATLDLFDFPCLARLGRDALDSQILPEALEGAIPPRVRLHAALMIRTVHFHHDLRLRRHEVHDVPPAHHRLPTKPDPELR